MDIFTTGTNTNNYNRETISWNDLVQIAFDLSVAKENQTKAYFTLFEGADYERGDKIFVNPEFFKEAKIPEVVKDRIIPDRFIDGYLKYAVFRGDNKPKPKFESEYGLVLNNPAVVINTNIA